MQFIGDLRTLCHRTILLFPGGSLAIPTAAPPWSSSCTVFGREFLVFPLCRHRSRSVRGPFGLPNTLCVHLQSCPLYWSNQMPKTPFMTLTAYTDERHSYNCIVNPYNATKPAAYNFTHVWVINEHNMSWFKVSGVMKVDSKCQTKFREKIS